jgi:CheY-like chemotaxis protein
MVGLMILAVVLFILSDILIRYVLKKMKEQKAVKERAAALDQGLKLDFTHEAKTLKRVTVEAPVARILCVDDEPIILDSFRKILVLDGYSVDTVEKGREALGLIQKHHYDFVFTDLKMPEMDGVEVTKSVRHLRPDIDVVIITGYATVETAVETMKYGAMDYVQKPFTEEELRDFVKKLVIRRNERIQKQLKPKVHITHTPYLEKQKAGEFSIPGGVFISSGHCWASVDQDGFVKVGIDDFAKKLIGKIDSIDFPNLGMVVSAGKPLFSVKQANRVITFFAPVTGQVTRVNTLLSKDLGKLDFTAYDDNWICIMDAENLDIEMRDLKIGNMAVSFYENEIERCRHYIQEMKKDTLDADEKEIYMGEFEKLDDQNWQKMAHEFFAN